MGRKALEKNIIAGPLGVLALLVLMCFAFTTFVGWGAFLRQNETASQLVLSWTIMFYSAWLGLFAASIVKVWQSLRPNFSQMKFSELSDKYEIVYDDPHNLGLAPFIKPKS